MAFFYAAYKYFVPVNFKITKVKLILQLKGVLSCIYKELNCNSFVLKQVKMKKKKRIEYFFHDNYEWFQTTGRESLIHKLIKKKACCIIHAPLASGDILCNSPGLSCHPGANILVCRPRIHAYIFK